MNEEFSYNRQPGLSKMRIGKPDGSPPLISIITPFYKAWDHFTQTYLSVCNQSIPFWEWIIVNDGDEEATERLESLIGDDSRIKVILQSNAGPANARNTALQYATASFVVPLDADDLLEPTYLECAYWTMQAHPEAGWAYTNSVGFGASEYLWAPAFSDELMKIQNDLTLTACIRRSVLEKVGGFDETYKYGYEDWILWLRLMRHGFYPIHMSWYGFWYRRSATGVSVFANKSRRTLLRQIYDEGRGIANPIVAIEYPRYTDFPHHPTLPGKAVRLDLPQRKRILFLSTGERLPREVNGSICFAGSEEIFTGALFLCPLTLSLRQEWEEHVNEVFDLTSFLDAECWMAFISQYIASRNVTEVVFEDDTVQKMLSPWLYREYPHLEKGEGSGTCRDRKRPMEQDEKEEIIAYYKTLLAQKIHKSKASRKEKIRGTITRSRLLLLLLRWYRYTFG
ncbi:glycosyltransferase family 2 protein [Ruminococcaceae bacterium OttesenSCG-928-L11]|nr:glycosyltransferase family 2 protein [Ruminococcaceae bacterium OttesenSCG-928-L11]